jgi:DNA primase large subunit
MDVTRVGLLDKNYLRFRPNCYRLKLNVSANGKRTSKSSSKRKIAGKGTSQKIVPKKVYLHLSLKKIEIDIINRYD